MIIRIFLVVLSGFSSCVQGAILFFDPPDVGFYSLGGDIISREIDLDLDGKNDVKLLSNIGSFKILALRDNTTVATFVTGGNDRGGNAIPYIAGDNIGSILPNPATWFTANDDTGASTLNACRDIGCLGFWQGGINYAGIRIEDEEGNFRYGWLEIDAQISGLTGGVLTRYAMETKPSVAIKAGSIPEPSSLILGTLGLLATLHRRR